MIHRDLEIFYMYGSMKNMLHIKQISQVPACGMIRTTHVNDSANNMNSYQNE